jgi:hypothetical protein
MVASAAPGRFRIGPRREEEWEKSGRHPALAQPATHLVQMSCRPQRTSSWRFEKKVICRYLLGEIIKQPTSYQGRVNNRSRLRLIHAVIFSPR